MKKTIGALAILVSATSAHALVRPEPVPVNEACVDVSSHQRALYAGSCDQTTNNQRYKVKLQKNGCAKKQAKFVSRDVKLPSCPDPRIAQL